MSYQHQWKDGTATGSTPGKIVCVGRNYAEHARELNNPVPPQPLLFIKPATAACPLTAPIKLPANLGSVHYETELAILIGRPLTWASEAEALNAIAGVGLALDLTLRELQARLKTDGHPWERAKGFDGACPLSPFVPASDFDSLEALQFSLTINGDIRQQGNTRDMITPLLPLLAHISETFTLLPGDVVLTGTPAGVGVLEPGQHLKLELGGRLEVETGVE